MTDKIPGGYILFARKFLGTDIMDKPPLWTKLFLWMLLKASRKDGYKGLKVGQLETSIAKMQEAMTHFVGYRKQVPTRKQIRVIYEGLAKGTTKGTTKGTHQDPMISVAKGTRGMIITILNYEKYQEPKNYQGHPKKPPPKRNEGPREKSTKEFWGAHLINRQEVYNKYKKICKHIFPEICTFVVDFIFHISDTKGNRAPIKTESLFEKSFDTVLELIRIDNFTFEYILEVIRWVPKDEFWNNNLFSLAALRKKSSNGLTKFQNIANAYEQRLNGKKPIKNNSRTDGNIKACSEFIEKMEREL